MRKRSNFNALLADLRAGLDFEASFRTGFGGDPSNLAAGWAATAAYSRK